MRLELCAQAFVPMIEISLLNQITLEGEVWKQIPDYPNYLISNLGRVYGGTQNRIDNGSLNDKGYRMIDLYNDNGRKRVRISHLVAAAFCKGYEAKKHIHHINRKRNDDRAINLLPCTPAEHRAIHAIYNILFDNADLLAELLTPIIHFNINLLFDDTKGGDVA